MIHLYNYLFPPRKTGEELMNDCKVTIKTGIRQLERSKEDLQYKCEEIKDQAKECQREGKKAECMTLAKQMVRYRSACAKMTKMIARMEEMQINIDILKSTQVMQKSLIQVTKAMIKINTQVSVKGMTELIKQFEKQSDAMQIKQEQMDDTMDNAMSEFDDDIEEKELMKQIMDEIGMEMDLPDATGSKDNNNNISNDELAQKLNELRK